MAVGSLEFLVGSWTGVLRSLLAVGLRLLQLLVGGGSLKGRSRYAAAYFIKADEESLQRASASKAEVIIFYNLIMEMTSITYSIESTQ